MTDDIFVLNEDSARRVAAAVVAVERNAPTEKRPRIRRPVVMPTSDQRRLVIIRDIPNPDGIELLVEYAVRHPNFEGDPDGPGGADALGRFVAASEFNQIQDPGSDPVEPEIVSMASWFHMTAGDFALFRWPAGPTTRETEILSAVFVLGGWHIRPDFRPYFVETNGAVPVGSCFPADQVLGLT